MVLNAGIKAFWYTNKFINFHVFLVDMFAIIPFYLSIVLKGLEDFDTLGKTGKIVRLV